MRRRNQFFHVLNVCDRLKTTLRSGVTFAFLPRMASGETQNVFSFKIEISLSNCQALVLFELHNPTEFKYSVVAKQMKQFSVVFLSNF